jgi:methylglyoxal synthase
LCSTAITGKYITEATGLEIEKLLSGKQGGNEQIALRIAYDEIDVLLYFRDTNQPFSESDLNILGLCDAYNVPVATNLGTAEAIIHSLDRGDLDWRELLK